MKNSGKTSLSYFVNPPIVNGFFSLTGVFALVCIINFIRNGILGIWLMFACIAIVLLFFFSNKQAFERVTVNEEGIGNSKLKITWENVKFCGYAESVSGALLKCPYIYFAPGKITNPDILFRLAAKYDRTNCIIVPATEESFSLIKKYYPSVTELTGRPE